jgi:hypothetical protein
MTVDPATGNLHGVWSRTRKVIGAGGWSIKLCQAGDGTKLVSNDVARPYYRKPGDPEWTPFLRMGDNYQPTGRHWSGTYTSAICWSNSDVMVSHIGGELWKTTDGGANVTLLPNFPADGYAWSNDYQNKIHGSPLEIDPANPAVIWWGGPVNGISYSIDGGDNWTQVPLATIPASGDTSDGGGRPYSIAFDRSSPVTAGRTQGIYIHSYGHGLYHSPDGGASFALMPGSPAACSTLAIGLDGVIHICGPGTGASADGPYYRYAAGAWSAAGPSGESVCLSAVHPGNVYIVNGAGQLACSFDNGASWTGFVHFTQHATHIRWFDVTNEWYMSHGKAIVDVITDNLCIAEGIGYWEVQAPLAAPGDYALALYEQSIGIEDIVTQNIRVRGDGKAYFAGMDRPVFAIPRAEAGVLFPASHGYVGTNRAIYHGGDVDYNPANPNRLVVPIYAFPDLASSDGGASWQDTGNGLQNAVGPAPGGYAGGGNVAVLTDDIWLRLLTSDQGLWRTADGGRSYAQIRIGNGLDQTSHHAYFIARRALVADRYVPGRALLNWTGNGNNPSDPNFLACRGLWETLDYGQNFARILDGPIESYTGDFWHGKLFQRSPLDWWHHGCDGSLALRRSIDNGHHWANVDGTDDQGLGTTFSQVDGLGFGPPALAGEAPVIYVLGYRLNGNYAPPDYSGYGIWLSRDDGAFWTRIMQFGDEPFVYSDCGAGDPGQFGIFYTGNTTEAATKVSFSDTRLLQGSTATPTPTPPPAFTTQPSITPASGLVGDTFTAHDGAASDATSFTRQWLLSGTAIGTGTTIVPASAGSLVLRSTAHGLGGTVTAPDTAAVTVSPTPTPTPGGFAFNPADKNPDLILSNANHTAANGGNSSYESVRGVTASPSTGKAHLALHVDANPSTTVALGMAWSGADLTAPPWTSLSDWVMQYVGYGHVTFHGSDLNPLPTFTTGDTVEMCVDFDANLAWFILNGASISGDPAAGTGGFDFNAGSYFPYVQVATGDQVTTIPGSPPAGFSPWDGGARGTRGGGAPYARKRNGASGRKRRKPD